MGKWNNKISEDESGMLSAFHGKTVDYLCPEEIRYHSLRYDKWVIVPFGYPSDGATGAIDLDSTAWWVHDKLCDTGKFEDGTKCTNWQASTILSDILLVDGHWFFARRWRIATFLFGGGEARRNGMFK